MELCGAELIQIDETEWIERRRHELILKKYRQNTQRLVKELQLRIQQQNHQVQQLTKEVKRQKFIIDLFTTESSKTADIQEAQHQIVNNDTRCIELFEPDAEPATIIYLDALDVNNESDGYQTAEANRVVAPHAKSYQTKRKIETTQKTDSTNKKLSLVSIQIQPNVCDATTIHVCDECNKTMSSRRVLAVCIHEMC